MRYQVNKGVTRLPDLIGVLLDVAKEESTFEEADQHFGVLFGGIVLPEIHRMMKKLRDTLPQTIEILGEEALDRGDAGGKVGTEAPQWATGLPCCGMLRGGRPLVEIQESITGRFGFILECGVDDVPVVHFDPMADDGDSEIGLTLEVVVQVASGDSAGGHDLLDSCAGIALVVKQDCRSLDESVAIGDHLGSLGAMRSKRTRFHR